MRTTICAFAWMLTQATLAQAAAPPLGSATLDVRRVAVDVDTRPDVPGLQYTASAVKEVSTGVMTILGDGSGPSPNTIYVGAVVKADLSGPAFSAGSVTVTAPPNQLMLFPRIAVTGTYYLSNIRLDDGSGNPLLERDPTLPVVTIEVVGEILATQVTTRALTMNEIQEKGIIITSDNFTAMSFTVGLAFGSEQVAVELPVLVPGGSSTFETPPAAQFDSGFGGGGQGFETLSIPNLSLSGFSLALPPELDVPEVQFPPVTGIIIIPGNIAFLNQFFSVIIVTTNTAPGDSGLELRTARAKIHLPPGADNAVGSGDDPLRMARTNDYPAGMPEQRPLSDPNGSDTLVPQGANQSDYLVEGLREGTHVVTFDILGDLYVPALGSTVPLTGTAAGVVQVRNPTFSVILAHPDVVRDGEDYSVFATVTNTSSTPANLFSLGLNTRSLSGARLAAGAVDRFTLDALLPGEAESFELRLTSMTTGEVRSTVFLADPGVNGQFLLTTGVGDTGIPSSPDTLVLPQTVDYIPDEPADLVFAALRLLGQAYSVATAPQGTLPADIGRMTKSFVFDRAVKLAQVGLHARFGEGQLAGAFDVLFDYFGSDAARVDELCLAGIAGLDPYDPNPAVQEKINDAIAARDQALSNLTAFDGLRRRAAAGLSLSNVLGEIVAGSLSTTQTVSSIQKDIAALFASRPTHISFGAEGAVQPAELRITDPDGQVLGVSLTGEALRQIPFADRLPLGAGSESVGDLLMLVSDQATYYDFDFVIPAWGEGGTLSVVIPGGVGLTHLEYSLSSSILAGASGHLRWTVGMDPAAAVINIDADGDGAPDTVLAPVITAIPDASPTILGVHQWGKGPSAGDPHPDFTNGDPLGRLVAVLFSEEVSKDDAETLANYEVPDHRVVGGMLQPDRRLLFAMLDKPVGPFIARDLTVQNVRDNVGQAVLATANAVVADPDLGEGGVVSGVVRAPDGTPVPFATIQYVQSQECMHSAVATGVQPRTISTITADMDGNYQIDFVLRNSADPMFRLEAMDPQTGHPGRATTEIRFNGQRLRLDLIIRGYASVNGHLYDEDGAIVAGGAPGEAGYLPILATNISTGESFVSWVDADGYYAFPRTGTRANGTVDTAPQVTVGNVVLRVVRTSDAATAISTVNLPAAGSTTTHDLILTSTTRYAAVEGRVLEADGTTGAANILVQIKAPVLTSVTSYERTYSMSVVDRTTTDSSGRFAFAKVPTGAIEVYAFRQSTYEQATAKSYLAEGETESVSLVFPGTGGRLTGRVVDSLGVAIAHAPVAGGPTLTESDALGYFEINDLPLGTFTIYAQAPDTSGTGKATITVNSPAFDDYVVIQIEPMGMVMGTVSDANGAAVGGQEVQLWVEGQNSGVMARTYTMADGYYEFRNYPVRAYSVRAVQCSYCDGGMAYTSIVYAGDIKTADIQFRGMGSVEGRVIQSNGTAVMADLILTRTVWRVIKPEADPNNNYVAFVDALSELDGIGQQVQGAFQSGIQGGSMQWFMPPQSEPTNTNADGSPLRSRGTDGRFEYTGSITGGPFKITAGNPFLTPKTVSLCPTTPPSPCEIPRTTVAAQRVVDVGDIVLESSTGSLAGRVLMPDGETPVHAFMEDGVTPLAAATVSILVRAGSFTGTVTTNPADGTFYVPVVAAGTVNLVADTLVPSSPAVNAATMDTETVPVNVRLYGSASVVVPPGGLAEADIRLLDVAGVDVTVVQDDGVTPVAGAKVTLFTSSTLDSELDRNTVVGGIPGYVNQTADANGVLSFFPVIEGKLWVRAAHPTTFATGIASAVIPENPASHSVVNVQVTLGAVTTAENVVTATCGFGSVNGTIFRANGTPLDNPAEVRLLAGGAHILTTSDPLGQFSLEDVPGGSFSIDVFEPYTARTGTATGSLACGGTATTNVTLVGLGSVAGTVLSADGMDVIPGAQVILYPNGGFTALLVTTSNLDGDYLLPGVPLGTYRVDALDYASGLKGSASDTMPADGAATYTNVYLQPSGSIRGVVYEAGVALVDGVPKHPDLTDWPDAPTAALASVVLKNGSFIRTVPTDGAGVFDAGLSLPVGTYSVTARPPAPRADGATGTAVLVADGDVVTLSMALRGSGTVSGIVLDSGGGQTVGAATITLQSRSPFAAGADTGQTESCPPGSVPECQVGTFSFASVPVGDFTISVKTTLQSPQLGATASGTVGAHDEVIAFLDADGDTRYSAIRLQDSGDIKGAVVLADGTTAAAGAIVTARSGTTVVTHVANSSGTFELQSLPLGTYTVSVLDPQTGGVAARTSVLDVNGQVRDLGNITLDDKHPAVTATTPAAGAADVSPGTSASPTPIVVVFNERLLTATVNATTFKVTRAGTVVAGALAIIDEPGANPSASRVTFTPSDRLADLSVFRVELKGERRDFEDRLVDIGMTDLSGWGLESTYVLTFTTGDTTPPSVVSRSPADEAIQVAAESVIRIELSEPLARSSVTSFTLTTTSVEPPCSVEVPCAVVVPCADVAWAPAWGDRVLILAPLAYLTPDHHYVVELQGPVADKAGNVSPDAVITWSFDTLDTIAPAVTAITYSPTATREPGTVLPLTAVVDSADVAKVELAINGQLVATDAALPFEYSLLLDASHGTSVTVGATPVDLAGNRGVLFEKLIGIVPNVPPNVSITDVSILPQGFDAWIKITASDATGVASISFAANGGAAGSGTYVLPMPETNPSTFERWWGVPADLAGGTDVTLVATATDVLGATRSSVSVVKQVVDMASPAVTITSPAPGSAVDPGQDIIVGVRGTDASKVKELRVKITGAFTFNEATKTISPAANPALNGFTVRVPADADDTQLATIQATAVDTTDKLNYALATFMVNDRTPPALVTVTPLNGATGVVTTTAVTAVFSEALGCATVTPTSVSLLDASASAVPATRSCSGSPSQVVLTPEAPLVPGVDYTLRLTTDIQDAKGNALAAPVVTTFTTDGTAPVVIAALPVSGSPDVSAVTLVTITFSEPLEPSSVTAASFQVMTETTQAAGTWQLQDGDTKVVWTPSAPLTYDTTYNVNLTAGITDLAGNTLTPVTATSFTVTGSPDADGDGISNVLEVALGTDPNEFTDFSTTDIIIENRTVTLDGDYQFNSVTLLSGGHLTHSPTTTHITGSLPDYESRLHLIVGSLDIQAGGSIDVTGKGYRGGGTGAGSNARGITLGNVEGAPYNGSNTGEAAGSYGGRGGDGLNAAKVWAGASYGRFDYPNELGSGGGGRSSGAACGGSGGGFVQIEATSIILDGTIIADGDADACGVPSGTVYSGGGSGGGVRISTTTFTGSGTVSADGSGSVGGAAHHYSGGGGGRIAVTYGQPSDLTFAGVIHARGGVGSATKGGAGTVFLKNANQQYGELRIDNGGVVAPLASTQLVSIGGNSSATPDAYFDLYSGSLSATTLTAIGAVSFPVYDPTAGSFSDLTGLRLNPNTDQPQTFIVVSNTAKQIVTGGGLMGVAAANQSYVGEYTLDKLVVGGGAKVRIADDIKVLAASAGTEWVLDDATLQTARLSLGTTRDVIVRNGALLECATLTADNLDTVTVTGATLFTARHADLRAGAVRVDAGTLTLNGTQTLGSLELVNGAVLTHRENWAPSAASAYPGFEGELDLIVGSVVIDSASSINVSGKGYRGGGRYAYNGAIGRTIGNAEATYQVQSSPYAAGSYGGMGGDGSGSAVTPSSSLYGDLIYPAHMGSGGAGLASDGQKNAGGNGGGLVQITANGLQLYGAIRADGDVNPFGVPTSLAISGGGAGGGVLLEVAAMSGAGTISANGTDTNPAVAYVYSGGGGGRIAIHYQSAASYAYTGSMSAKGGRGRVTNGGAGTIYVKNEGDALGYGDLTIDNGGVGNGTAYRTQLRAIGARTSSDISWDGVTGITTIVVGSVDIFPVPDSVTGAVGLVGLFVNPNTAQSSTFSVVGNTAWQLFVDANLTGVATAGNPLIGVYFFDNVTILNGARVSTADRVVVGGTTTVDGTSAFSAAP
ncbi:MAG: Ig-like domain-containing protein [Deltaproteobacteria bacterium]|nr:Ig-like domain-containing protein [Deltaproteobacteria bacterium]